MKTTIDIADSVLDEARELARREGITLKALVEQGLRAVLANQPPPAPFRLRPASVKGQGLQAELQGASWERLRELAYEGHGT